MKQYWDNQEWENYRAAIICAVIANVNRNPKKKAFQPKDFMPEKAKTKSKKKLTGEQMLERVNVINTILGGEVK